MESIIHESRVDTGVATFHYATAGDGPPVVLLPGRGGWLLTFQELAPALAAHHTVYALDPPGQGRTTLHERRGPFGTDAVVQSIAGFLDELGVDRAAFLGHSQGGGFALRFAEVFPDRVTRLALLAPAGAPVTDIWEFRALRLPGFGELALCWMSALSARRLLRKSFADRDRVPEDRIADYLRLMRSPGRTARIEDLLRVERSVAWEATERDLHLITAPALLLWGTADRCLPVGLAHRLEHRIRRARTHLVDGAGHFLHDERPDETLAHLTRFLAVAV